MKVICVLEYVRRVWLLLFFMCFMLFFFSLPLILHIVAFLFDCFDTCADISGYVVHAAIQCTGITYLRRKQNEPIRKMRAKRNLKSIELLLLLFFSYFLLCVCLVCDATVIAHNV